MALYKNYDEMVDRYTYYGDDHLLIKQKYGFGVVHVKPAFVDLSEGGDLFWLIFKRKGDDWHWIQNTNFIVLADGNRMSGVGEVRDSQVLQEAGWFETKIMCYEEIHCSGTFDAMKIIGEAKSVKVRLGEVDMVLPEGLLQDIRLIINELESTGGYGES